MRSFDERTHAGDLLLDDGTVLTFGEQVFRASGLRLLRLGQRVRIDLSDDGGVRRLTLATLPFRD